MDLIVRITLVLIVQPELPVWIVCGRRRWSLSVAVDTWQFLTLAVLVGPVRLVLALQSLPMTPLDKSLGGG